MATRSQMKFGNERKLGNEQTLNVYAHVGFEEWGDAAESLPVPGAST